MSNVDVRIPVPVPAGGSVTVPGPLSDGDTATFHVAAPPPVPWDVSYTPAVLTSAGLAGVIAAHPGKVIGLGAGVPAGMGMHLPAMLDIRRLHVQIVQLAPIVSPLKGIVAAIRECDGLWIGGDFRGPTVQADFKGVLNGREQEHGVVQYGGSIVWDHLHVEGVMGDGFDARPWAKKNGGSGVPPVVRLIAPDLHTCGRCGWAIISAISTHITSPVVTDIGAWCGDFEPNYASDLMGPITIDGNGVLGTHGLGNDPKWWSDGFAQSLAFSGPAGNVPHGPVTVSGLHGDNLDILVKRVGSIAISDCVSVHPAQLLLSGVGKHTESGLVNFTVKQI